MAPHSRNSSKSAREAGVFVVFVRNLYTTENNSTFRRMAGAGRAQANGGYTRIPVCARTRGQATSMATSVLAG